MSSRCVCTILNISTLMLKSNDVLAFANSTLKCLIFSGYLLHNKSATSLSVSSSDHSLKRRTKQPRGGIGGDKTSRLCDKPQHVFYRSSCFLPFLELRDVSFYREKDLELVYKAQRGVLRSFLFLAGLSSR